MSTQYAFPSELLYEATALADGDWVVVQKTGERRLAKISGLNFGNISGLSKNDGNFIVGDGTQWVVESGATARASLTAAALTGSLDENWRCANLRTSTGYLFEQVQDGSVVGAIRLEDETYSAMSFRNAGGFRFYGLSGATPGSVVVGSLQTRTITPETAGTYHIGSVALPFDDGFFTGALNVRAVTSRQILPESDGVYNIGSNLVRFASGYFDYVYAANYSGDSFHLTGDSDTGIYSGGANILGFATAGVERATFSAAGHFLPFANGSYTLGNSDSRWKEIWCTQSSINSSSDGRLKTDVKDSDLGLDFIRSLHPVVYRAVYGDIEVIPPPDSDGKARIPGGKGHIVSRPGVRPHYGLVAQEVKAAMGGRDFAGYLYDPDTDTHGLRYGEFIAPMVKAMQELHGQVQEERQARLALEQRLAVLEVALGPVGASRAKA